MTTPPEDDSAHDSAHPRAGAHFLTDLVVVKTKNRRADDEDAVWRLVESVFYYSAWADKIFIVPSGFTTDFASVPRLPLAYLLTGDTVHAPAVVHDHLVRSKIVPRADADRIFLEAMKADGVSWWRRTLMYIAVSAYTATVAKVRRA